MNQENAHHAGSSFVLATFFDGVETAGGVYVHRVGLLKVLLQLEQSSDIKVVVVCGNEAALSTARQVGLTCVLKPRTFLRRILGFICSNETIRRRFGRWVHRISPWDAVLSELRCDLVYFGGHDHRATQLYRHNYIFTVYDVCHLEHPEFPEVSHFGEFERREQLFQNVLKKAAAIITDSRAGRKLIARHYAVPISRIHAAPFLISETVTCFVEDPAVQSQIFDQYNVKHPYIFYPAQFWQHKNHRYIIDALAIMLERFGWAPQAIFCGSDKGNLEAVLRYAKAKGVGAHVNYCGFVPAEHLPHLYRGALALVMPTYFGPSNIPPIEACALGVPVCYSDMPAFREQLGDAAHYVDLSRPDSLAETLEGIRTGEVPQAGSGISWREILQAQKHEHMGLLRHIVDTYRQKIPFCWTNE